MNVYPVGRILFSKVLRALTLRRLVLHSLRRHDMVKHQGLNFKPDDSHALSLRRSSREHKKRRPYYAPSQAEPPDKPSTSKGLQRGFLK